MVGLHPDLRRYTALVFVSSAAVGGVGLLMLAAIAADVHVDRTARPRPYRGGHRRLHAANAVNQDLLRQASELSALPEGWRDYFRKRLGSQMLDGGADEI